MKHEDGNFTGCRDRSVYYQVWQPDGPVRAVLLLAHGAGEHSNRYRHVAEYFTTNGFALVALDHNGHGKSEGVPGHVTAFEDYLEDLSSLQKKAQTQFAGAPLFLLGHSLGGLIASSYLLQHQHDFVGCILSGPAVKTELEPGAVQMTIIRVLSVLLPKTGLLQLDAAGVSRDPEVVRDYVQDPLVHHGKMSVRKLREIFSTMRVVQTRAGEIQLPMLIMHGEKDTMAAPEGSRFLHQALGSQDKTLKLYPELFHEIFNEPEQLEVLAEVLHWCEARLPQR